MKIKSMEKVSQSMSEYKTGLHHVVHPISTNSWLMHSIKTIISYTDKIICKHKYKFENIREIANYDTAILKRSKYDFIRALAKETGTRLQPGSESRTSQTLQVLLGEHEHWDKMNEIMTHGVSYSLKDLPEQIRKDDLEYMIARGNHKSAISEENEVTLLKSYEKEVEYGLMLPVTFESVTKIKGAGVIPVGLATQFTIDNIVNKKTKRRTTHDASFPPPSEKISKQ